MSNDPHVVIHLRRQPAPGSVAEQLLREDSRRLEAAQLRPPVERPVGAAALPFVTLPTRRARRGE